MEKSEKRVSDLARVLADGSERDIDARIRLLRAEAPFRGALRLLAAFYDTTDNEPVKQLIAALFNDIKDLNAREEVVESMRSVNKDETRIMLASSCWQSGLDYSPFSIPLAEQFITGDYITSLECLTVLETCALTIPVDERQLIITRLQQKMALWDSPKQHLARELITLLKE